jgi:hypothetical protein
MEQSGVVQLLLMLLGEAARVHLRLYAWWKSRTRDALVNPTRPRRGYRTQDTKKSMEPDGCNALTSTMVDVGEASNGRNGTVTVPILAS